MIKNVSVDQGEFSSSYWCEECWEFLNTLDYWDLEDGLGFGELLNFEEYEYEFSK